MTTVHNGLGGLAGRTLLLGQIRQLAHSVEHFKGGAEVVFLVPSLPVLLDADVVAEGLQGPGDLFGHAGWRLLSLSRNVITVGIRLKVEIWKYRYRTHPLMT